MRVRTPVTLASVCIVGLAASDHPSPPQVSLPPSDASTFVVLDSYLRALVTENCRTARGVAPLTPVGLRLGTGRTIIACHAITTLGVLVMVGAGGVLSRAGLGRRVAVLGAGEGLYGLAMGMSNSHEMSFRQLVTPDELQARTNTTLRSLNRAVMVIAAQDDTLLYRIEFHLFE